MRLSAVLGNATLIVLGIGMALGIMELALRLNPNLAPDEVRVDPPVRRVRALNDESYEVRLSDGDLYHWMVGRIAPLPPEKDRVVAQVHMVTDENGFRNSGPEKTTYDIVAVGDSFTIAGNVAVPWPQALAEYSGSTVLNLGEAGSGPQQQLAILRDYGLDKQPKWVILAYFGGNDLYDVSSYEQATPFLLARVGKHFLARGAALIDQSLAVGGNESSAAEAAATSEASTFLYPITITIADSELEMAFFSYYISWLTVPRQTIDASENLRLVQETVLEMQRVSEGVGAEFVLVYVPSAPHVYLPYIDEPQVLARIFADVPMVEMDGSGYLQFANQKATAEIVAQHMDAQAQALGDFAAANQINYLNLTPHFQEGVGQGEELYFPYDTHWNQNGHMMAAELIAGALGLSAAPGAEAK